jgi:hypothetical protein
MKIRIAKFVGRQLFALAKVSGRGLWTVTKIGARQVRVSFRTAEPYIARFLMDTADALVGA